MATNMFMHICLCHFGAHFPHNFTVVHTFPDSKIHGAYMGPTWGQQDPGGPHVGPMNLAIRVILHEFSRRLTMKHRSAIDRRIGQPLIEACDIIISPHFALY